MKQLNLDYSQKTVLNPTSITRIVESRKKAANYFKALPKKQYEGVHHDLIH